MSVPSYDRALDFLESNEISIRNSGGASEELIDQTEVRLGVTLPLSYKKMLSNYGTLSFRGRQYYGVPKLGIDAQSIPNVVFATLDLRSRDEASAKMVNFKASGYGPNFVIDCGQLDQRGEGPVYEIHELGYMHGMKKVADSFGEFLLNDVKILLENQ
jgi:SMI1-KNR4 cell-wall